MSLWIEWEIEEPASKEDFERLLERSLEAALSYEGVDTPVEVSLSIVSKEAIHELNRDFRQVDRVTDVLSFPMLSYEESPRMTRPAGPDVKEASESEENLDPDTGEVLLGDVVLCMDVAKEQAAE